MSRLIDAEVLKEDLTRFYDGEVTARQLIDKQPTVETERKYGRWIPIANGRIGYECCQCHCYAPSYEDGTEWTSDFCPNCGADMRGSNP